LPDCVENRDRVENPDCVENDVKADMVAEPERPTNKIIFTQPTGSA